MQESMNSRFCVTEILFVNIYVIKFAVKYTICPVDDNIKQYITIAYLHCDATFAVLIQMSTQFCNLNVIINYNTILC